MSPTVLGNLGRFNFQVFLLSLVSSVALLAASSAVVKFLAFYILPNRCVAAFVWPATLLCDPLPMHAKGGPTVWGKG